jgi:hypothetical protein
MKLCSVNVFQCHSAEDIATLTAFSATLEGIVQHLRISVPLSRGCCSTNLFQWHSEGDEVALTCFSGTLQGMI